MKTKQEPELFAVVSTTYIKAHDKALADKKAVEALEKFLGEGALARLEVVIASRYLQPTT